MSLEFKLLMCKEEGLMRQRSVRALIGVKLWEICWLLVTITVYMCLLQNKTVGYIFLAVHIFGLMCYHLYGRKLAPVVEDNLTKCSMRLGSLLREYRLERGKEGQE